MFFIKYFMTSIRKCRFAFFLLLSFFIYFFSSYIASAQEKIKHLGALSGISGETVFKIFKDSNGFVWIGTNDGLCCYNGVDIVRFEDFCLRG